MLLILVIHVTSVLFMYEQIVAVQLSLINLMCNTLSNDKHCGKLHYQCGCEFSPTHTSFMFFLAITLTQIVKVSTSVSIYVLIICQRLIFMAYRKIGLSLDFPFSTTMRVAFVGLNIILSIACITVRFITLSSPIQDEEMS